MSTINISHAVSKTYTLIDKNHKYYVSSWYDDGNYRKTISLSSISENQKTIAPCGYTIDNAISTKKLLNDIAPIDIRVLLDNVEITDDQRKSEILESLIIFEYRSESKIYVKSLTDQGAKLAKEEEVLRSQLNNMITSMSLNMNGLSLNKCKKLKAAINEITEI